MADINTDDIAFLQESVDEINKIVSSIDARLFLFADYENKTAEGIDSNRLLFVINVINAYGLFFDCGKELQKRILTRKENGQKPSVMKRLAEKHLRNHSNFVWQVAAIRNTLCHNLSLRYYNNHAKHKQYTQFLERINYERKKEYEISEKEWKNINQTFVKDCNSAEKSIINYLSEISQIIDKGEKAKIVHFWLTGIKSWYENENEHFLNHILCSIYAPKCYPRAMTSWKAKEHLERDWHQLYSRQKEVDNDCYLECKKRMKLLLTDERQCPTPALPFEVYTEITSDIKLCNL